MKEEVRMVKGLTWSFQSQTYTSF